MIGLSAFAVFALGLRHGADPDHIAAIDNMTRNSYEKRPWLSRFCGTIFAGGHSVMVLSIAALVGLLGTHLGRYGATIETIGTWISIAVLILIALLNLRQLKTRGDGRIAGVKTRLLPRVLREATSPWVALPVGLLFGFGFETSSQVLAYSVAFGVNAGVFGALLVGAMFCLGMVVTDTLDSVLVHRLVSDRASLRTSALRAWIWTVTLVALAVAGYELAQILGWQSPVPDIYISGAIVASLVAVFAYVFVTTRRTNPQPASTIGTPS
jgi:high-affinity nickel-transport protein